MRRAYISADEPLDSALARALDWAGKNATIHAPDTASIEHNKLNRLGVPVTSASSKSRFHGRPHGTVIGVLLNLNEVLDVERNGRTRGTLTPTVDGLIVLDAYGPMQYAETGLHHSPWITAFDVEHLAGESIPHVPPAPAPVRAAIRGLTNQTVLNQGLQAKQLERSEAIHALVYLRNKGFPLDPDALMVEALRNQWGGTGAEDLRQIGIDLNKGTNLQYNKGRLSAERLQQWAAAGDQT